ncbi:MAG: uroporphyrinogen-III C-methyltransferase [Gammaproteobacteria bacterium]|nr:uroporphyrinogen-III C-methyltransferase [Gammaproteobacteria bacterium]
MTQSTDKEHKDSPAKAKVKSKPEKRIKEKHGTTPKRRRWPLLLTFIIATASAGGVYYLWQEYNVLIRSIALSAQQAQTDFMRGNERLKQQIKESDNRVVLLEQSILGLQGKDNMDWLVSEAEYLIRIANHRLLLEYDVKSALVALKSADSRLFDTQDPYWIPVRNHLAQEIARLEALQVVDVAGLSLRLNTLGEAILQMPILKPEPTARSELAPATEAKPEAKYWSEVWDDMSQRLGKLVSIRTVERPPGPLLEPQQAAYLQQNLLLKLEGVKLALLRGEPQLYRDGLKATRGWIESFYDTSSPATREVLKHLTALHEIQIRPDLPDLGLSLKTIQETRLQRARDIQKGAR